MVRDCLWAVSVVALTGAVLVAAPVPGSSPGLPDKGPPPCFGLLVVAVKDGAAYTITDSMQEGPITIRLWEAPLRAARDNAPEGGSRTFRGWVCTRELDRLHWRIAHDHIWTDCMLFGLTPSSHQVPLEDLPLLDAKNAERGAARLREKYGDEAAGTAHWFSGGLSAHALEQLRPLLNAQIGLGGHPPIVVDQDILPTGAASWDGFVLHESKLTAYACSRQPRRKGDAELPPVTSKKLAGPVDAGFQEPFFAYGISGDCFLVTKSRRVFRLRYAEGKEPRVEKVWDDDKRPVTTILNDADTGRTFVAGRDLSEGQEKWFYFELADKVEKKPFDRAAVQAEAEEPLKSALLFARFLAKEGKVKDKPK